MSDSFSLETELERRAENDADAENFWDHYKVVKRHLTDNYYPWIRDNCPHFTDHGEKHIASIMQAASGLLEKDLDPKRKSQLESLDLFLILSAIIWHDVGMVIDRFQHAEQIHPLTQRIRELAFNDQTIQKLVVDIARAHVRNNGLSIPRFEQDWSSASKTYTVYPRALAAIVRFADEISENRSRISQEILDLEQVPAENRIYWEFANCISATRPDPARERVVLTLDIQEEAAVTTYICPEEINQYANNAGEISLMEYIISRLEKMNNEREYCAQEFRKYVSISAIVVRLNLLKGENPVSGYELEIPLSNLGLSQTGYPNIKVFTQFFKQHPSWLPERISEVSSNEAD